MGYKLYETGKRFSRDLTMTCEMVDKSYKMKPYAFMNLAQEMAMDGADKLGFGYEKLFPKRLAWVLSRMHVHYEDAPVWPCDMRLDTWHRGVDGLFYRRDYELLVDGKVKVTGTSSWVIINLDTRAMERPEVMFSLCDPEPQCEDAAITSSAPRLRMPRGVTAEKVCDHVVAYSDLDFNGHANNTKYISWVMDCVDREVSGTRCPKDVYINYSKEILEGETVSIYRVVEKTEDSISYFFQGQVDGHDAFIAKVVY